jgi:hypothetical protein
MNVSKYRYTSIIEGAKMVNVNQNILEHWRLIGRNFVEIKPIGPDKFVVRPRQLLDNIRLIEGSNLFLSLYTQEIDLIVREKYGEIFFLQDCKLGFYKSFWP